LGELKRSVPVFSLGIDVPTIPQLIEYMLKSFTISLEVVLLEFHLDGGEFPFSTSHNDV
jgi:hypothetical protein